MEAARLISMQSENTFSYVRGLVTFGGKTLFDDGGLLVKNKV